MNRRWYHTKRGNAYFSPALSTFWDRKKGDGPNLRTPLYSSCLPRSLYYTFCRERKFAIPKEKAGIEHEKHGDGVFVWESFGSKIGCVLRERQRRMGFFGLRFRLQHSRDEFPFVCFSLTQVSITFMSTTIQRWSRWGSLDFLFCYSTIFFVCLFFLRLLARERIDILV